MYDLKKAISLLTLEEKAGLCSGLDFWHTKGVERLNIPSVMVSDGPHGLRKQEEGADHLGIHDSIQAVCFPAACATSASFDRALLYEMGETLGQECAAENVAILLGPAVNMKRAPVCGRNFEYFSEDPFLAGELACAFTKGVQSKGVGVSVKHFAANNQETRRMTVSSKMSERTLREIYFPAFEKVVKEAQPQTVMCAYNKINGVYASENEWLLTKILRDEWGFEGFVVSDWYAVNDRVRALRAGLDLEMPGGDGANDKRIIEAVKSGELSEEILDKAVERILKVVLDCAERRKTEKFDRKADHKKAVALAQECAVLLKNEGALPLTKTEKVLFIGEFAKIPRYQGGGSSHVNAYSAEGALRLAENYGVSYIKGFGADGSGMREERAEAVLAAKSADKVVVFAGLPDSYESEGYDRTHIALPECQNLLIKELIESGSNVTVVLHNGSPVAMPWIKGVNAVLEVYLGGEGVGEATVNLLYGNANPSGRLAETFPIKLEDNPAYLNFPGDKKEVDYSEGVFIGYRYYDSKKQEVLFPFGYGLSYTHFTYENLIVSKKELRDDETLEVCVEVKNVGTRAGKETVQLYVSDQTQSAVRPVRELKAFDKIALEAGEKKTVRFLLDQRSFAYWNEEISDWYCASGEYEITVAKHSRDRGVSEKVVLRSTANLPLQIDGNTTVEQLFTHPATRAVMQGLLQKTRPHDDGEKMGKKDDAMMRAAYLQAPLRTVRLALNLSEEQYGGLLQMLRGALEEQ